MNTRASPGLWTNFFSTVEVDATPLIIASGNGSLEAVRLLIHYNADPDLKDEMGQTTLMRASRREHVKIVEILCNQVEDMDLRDRSGYSALHTAVFFAGFKSTDVILALLKAGADTNARDHQDRTALYYAAHHGKTSVVEILLRWGADIKGLSNSWLELPHLANDEERKKNRRWVTEIKNMLGDYG